MMHGHGKSDSPIVLRKPSNEAGPEAKETVEERGLAKGNLLEPTCPGHRAGKACLARLSEYVRQQGGRRDSGSLRSCTMDTDPELAGSLLRVEARGGSRHRRQNMVALRG